MDGTLNLRCGAGLEAGMSAVIAAGTASPYAGGRAHGIALTADAGGVAVVAWRPGEVLDLAGNAWTPGTGVWAAAVGGYTQVDPGGGETDEAYLGVAITGTMLLLDLPAFRSAFGGGAVEEAVEDASEAVVTALLRDYDGWTVGAPTFSAGNAASMDNAATATLVLDLEDGRAQNLDLAWGFTFGGAPSADAPLTVSHSYDGGTNWESTPTYNFTEATAAGTAVKRFRRIAASDSVKLVLTNSTGQAITSVWMKWRGVRG
jgi:hypothetical protein